MLQFKIKNITIAAVLAAGVTALGIMSCTKKVNTDSYATFLGEWRVNDGCSGFETPSFTISEGSNSYSMRVKYRIGYKSLALTTTRDSCQRDVTVDALVNSDAAKDYFSIKSQVVTDVCGHNYTISGGATIRRAVKNDEVDSLKITMVTTTTGGSTACSFTGHK